MFVLYITCSKSDMDFRRCARYTHPISALVSTFIIVCDPHTVTTGHTPREAQVIVVIEKVAPDAMMALEWVQRTLEVYCARNQFLDGFASGQALCSSPVVALSTEVVFVGHRLTVG